MVAGAAGGGVLGVSGVVIVMQPGNVPSASERTMRIEITKSFIFTLFIVIYN